MTEAGVTAVKTGNFDTSWLSQSVISVPPLARTIEMHIAPLINEWIMAYQRQHGITTFLYGGNANLYHIGLTEFAELLDVLEAYAPPDAWIIPSVGPAYGQMMAQADQLRGRQFPLAMVLPANFAAGPVGNDQAIRSFVERCGRPVLLYVKSDDYLSIDHIAHLVEDGYVAAVKYAVPRAKGMRDAMLDELVGQCGGHRIVSGFGEQPALAHMRDYGLAGFTAGTVCLAPHVSASMLKACRTGDYRHAAVCRARLSTFEGFRDRHGPIEVLHYALAWAGLAETGPILPPLSPPRDEHRDAIAEAARELLALVPAE
jgi:4-hydroxy-tetrahydrodipicolinate synthase